MCVYVYTYTPFEMNIKGILGGSRFVFFFFLTNDDDQIGVLRHAKNFARFNGLFSQSNYGKRFIFFFSSSLIVPDEFRVHVDAKRSKKTIVQIRQPYVTVALGGARFCIVQKVVLLQNDFLREEKRWNSKFGVRYAAESFAKNGLYVNYTVAVVYAHPSMYIYIYIVIGIAAIYHETTCADPMFHRGTLLLFARLTARKIFIFTSFTNVHVWAFIIARGVVTTTGRP